jgi:hypothetical protein
MTPAPAKVFAYVQLHRGTSFASKLIRFQRLSPYTHVSIMLPDGTIYESMQGHGVRTVHATYYADDYAVGRVDVCPLEFEADKFLEMEAFLKSQVGKKYDWPGVFRFVTRVNPWGASDDRWYCGAYVFQATAIGGRLLLARTETHEAAPDLIARSPILPDLV